MDVYRGIVDPLAPDTHQIHDFDPGIAPNGLFWTIAVPSSAVDVDLDTGTARVHATDVALRDYFTILNAVTGGAFVAATASFDVRWSGVTMTEKVRDTAQGWAAELQRTGSHIDWSGRTADFAFVSQASGQTSLFAEIGHERNGVFYAEAG